MNTPGNLPGLPSVVDEPGPAGNPLPAQPVPPADPMPSTQSTGAQDADTIEEAWVHRVEQLFHQYGDDPYILNAHFARLKAEYINRRYGKQIEKAEL